ncbi:MAG: sn-glycerol-3-phosphate ABC transporter ATP-binding protein UgpC [Ignavibacteriales bacterium]|nr:sn-glycerol-3-phosphate ABC transporter ATP-binding protein UgpC [Ignavibacteriales bacterium]
MASVRLENLKKTYEGGKSVVNGVDVTIEDKEFVVLVGPSGCGKSTTLRMIAGLEDVTEGKVFIDDKAVNDLPPKDRDIAMVFQNYALYPHMTVFENIAFGLRLRGFPKNEIEKRVREAASILGIEELLDRKPKALSGGQRQRAAIGRAIVRKPKVFLFDEPLSNLDAKLRVQMRTEISRLHQRLETTMIYVTHDQTEAMTMGDKIVVMKDGFAQQIAEPLDLYNHPKNRFVAGFIGSPAMNFFEGTIAGSQNLVFKEQQGSFQMPVPREGKRRLKSYVRKKVIMGLRPEHIHRPGSRLPKGAKVAATVQVVEPMGNEIYTYFSLGKEEKQYTARFDAAVMPIVGKRLDVLFDTSKAHFFNTETEAVI